VNFPQSKVFCDTSFFFAALCSEDANFEKAGALLEHCVDHNVTLCTSWDIISETVTLLRYRANYKTALSFLSAIKPSLLIVRYDDSVRDGAEEVFKKLSKDKRISFCDALSFVLVTHVLDDMPCLTFDKDFRGLGLTVYP
jgi:predicted nucleic acid-binding protein